MFGIFHHKDKSESYNRQKRPLAASYASYNGLGSENIFPLQKKIVSLPYDYKQ